MRIIEVSRGRDNNFNLIRFVAANAVLLSHCFALHSGRSSDEPLLDLIGMTPGALAVDAFFITSGFLVAGSLLVSGKPIDFVIARVFRIYPALIIMTLLSAFILGLSFTTLSLWDYLSHPQTSTFILKNVTLFWGTSGGLPGVFYGNPFPGAVNASLWTLPFEVRMYALLLLLWGVLYFFHRLFVNSEVAMLAAGLPLTFVAGVWHFKVYFFEHVVDERFRLLFMFFLGATFYLLRSKIVLSTAAFFIAMTALFLATLDHRIFFIVYHLVVAYVVIWLAYVPAGDIRKFNNVGDYSYGTYIYAFPLQQSLIALLPGLQLVNFIIFSFLITLFFAMSSWYLVEQPALAQARSVRIKYANARGRGD